MNKETWWFSQTQAMKMHGGHAHQQSFIAQD